MNKGIVPNGITVNSEFYKGVIAPPETHSNLEITIKFIMRFYSDSSIS